MSAGELACSGGRRLQDVRDAALYGFDYVDVSDDQKTLEVFFLGKAPAGLKKENVRITGGRKIRDIAVVGLTVTRQVDPSIDDEMEVDLDKYGDFSTYTLSLVALDDQGHPTDNPLPGFDPFYGSVDFSFKIDCPNDQDCAPAKICPPEPSDEPEINHLAKDYDSFRQLLLDRLALTCPGWQESHVPDVGIMLVELIAYAADQLSYFQDAVATEAYLRTARRRISVRRHARLVDYTLHEGCNARAFVTIAAENDTQLDPTQVFFCTSFPGMPGARVLQPDDLRNADPTLFECFSSLLADGITQIQLYKAHNKIDFYTWGDCACCLPRGATSAALVDQWVPPPTPPPVDRPSAVSPPASASVVQSKALQAAATPGHGEPPGSNRVLNLKPGDVLIFEEVFGPKTGIPEDADPKHRQAVRLTKVTRTVDPLYHPSGTDYGQPIVEIEWCSEDALTFPLCISAQMPPPDCDCRAGISVARGNVVLVEHGTPEHEPVGTVCVVQSQENCPTDCSPSETVILPAPFRTKLKQTPLSFREPLDACACAAPVLIQDPRQALPRLRLTGTVQTPQGPVATRWTAVRDLLESAPSDRHFVVEIDDDGIARVRFGNGREGEMPDAGMSFAADYWVGNGPAGNVGAETLLTIAFRQLTEVGGKLEARNPLAATGGTAPGSVAEARAFAPFAFRDVLERAITADDYAAIAADNARRRDERSTIFASWAPAPSPSLSEPATRDPRAALDEEPDEESPLTECFVPFHALQGAKATLRWTGSWYEAQVGVDPAGTETADAELLAEVQAYLKPYRRIGHDLRVKQADYVPIDLALSVCMGPLTLRGDVETTLLGLLGSGVLPDGRLGFFHPDNLEFGEGVYASRIIALAQSVRGVTEVQILRLMRLHPTAPAASAADRETPASGVLLLAPYEIARLDNDPSQPQFGRLTLLMRGGR